MRTIRNIEGGRLEIDLAPQVLVLDAPEDTSYNVPPGGVEVPLSPLATDVDQKGFLSAALLAHKAKVFDDGLFAATELAAQTGRGAHRGKVWLLRELASELIDRADDTAAVRLMAALVLGDAAAPSGASRFEPDVQSAVQDFLRDDSQSKPLGIYASSPALRAIFQQDRWLQQPLTAADADAISRVLDERSDVKQAHRQHLNLTQRLTNPPDPKLQGSFLFPPSKSHESVLIQALYGDSPVPEGFTLADELMRRIKSREVDLMPRENSGWYDYQTWALEPLIVPERMPEWERVRCMPRYRRVLEQLFKALLGLTRETHVKQLQMPEVLMSGEREPVVHLAPEIEIEPLVTFYRRRAIAYRMVRDVLIETFGPHVLEDIHRESPAGPVPASLSEELEQMTCLFHGAAVTARARLGFADEQEDDEALPDPAISASRFSKWSAGRSADPDLANDVRAMVPVFFDRGRRQWKTWLFLGWASRPITVSFDRLPRVTAIDPAGRPLPEQPRIVQSSCKWQVPYAVSAEIYVDRLLNRDEFRELCDAEHSVRGIIGRLA